MNQSKAILQLKIAWLGGLHTDPHTSHQDSMYVHVLGIRQLSWVVIVEEEEKEVVEEKEEKEEVEE